MIPIIPRPESSAFAGTCNMVGLTLFSLNLYLTILNTFIGGFCKSFIKEDGVTRDGLGTVVLPSWNDLFGLCCKWGISDGAYYYFGYVSISILDPPFIALV